MLHSALVIPFIVVIINLLLWYMFVVLFDWVNVVIIFCLLSCCCLYLCIFQFKTVTMESGKSKVVPKIQTNERDVPKIPIPGCTRLKCSRKSSLLAHIKFCSQRSHLYLISTWVTYKWSRHFCMPSATVKYL